MTSGKWSTMAQENRTLKTKKQPMIVTREAPSRALQPCTVFPEPDENDFYSWCNDAYYGTLQRFTTGFPLGTGEHVVIGITAKDETARHDWRDFQQIKNSLVGVDWEAVELYPSERRLKDPSNRFYLWCVPFGVLTFGLPGGRLVLPAARAVAPQRPFPGEGGGRRKWPLVPPDEAIDAALAPPTSHGARLGAATALVAMGLLAQGAVEGGRRGDE